MSRSPKIYAVTLNWNSYENVCECVESLRKSEQTLEKIVIIDNASADGSGQRLTEHFKLDERVVVIHNEVNEGFARAVNIGMKRALAENATHVFLINNDASIDSKCLGTLIESLQSDSAAGAAAPTVFYREQPQRIWLGAGYFNYLRANIVAPEQNQTLRETEGRMHEVTFVSGCALLLRTDMLKVTGLFDPDMFFYGEDVDFSLRAIRQGYKLLYVPNAHAWHKIADVPRSRSSPYVMYHRARSLLIFFRKNFSWPYFLYAISLHLLLYSPYRFWQSLHGQTPLQSFLGWMRGTIHGLFAPSRNWVG